MTYAWHPKSPRRRVHGDTLGEIFETLHHIIGSDTDVRHRPICLLVMAVPKRMAQSWRALLHQRTQVDMSYLQYRGTECYRLRHRAEPACPDMVSYIRQNHSLHQLHSSQPDQHLHLLAYTNRRALKGRGCHAHPLRHQPLGSSYLSSTYPCSTAQTYPTLPRMKLPCHSCNSFDSQEKP